MTCLTQIKQKIEREYETPRTGSEQRKWAEEIIKNIKTCELAHNEFRCRRPPFKRFVEEALPIARFVDFKTEFQNSTVTLRIGSQPYDAEVSVSGGREHIEVVNSIDGHQNSIIMQILNKFGFAPGTIVRPIQFLKNLLNSGHPNEYVGDVVYPQAEFDECMERLSHNIESKIDHGYTGRYHLLACFDLDTDTHNLNDIEPRLTRFANQTTFQTITLYERRSGHLLSLD